MSGPINNEINNADQAIIKSYNHADPSLNVTLRNATVDLNVSAFTDSIKIGDGTGQTATITPVGGTKSLDVNVTDIAITHTSDSIRLGDGTNFITSTAVGAKTALDVTVAGGTVAQIPSGVTRLEYDSNTVSVGGTQTIVSFTVPSGIYLQKVYLSGTSIGIYTVLKNGTPLMVYRMSQTQFSAVIDLATSTAWGIDTVSGDVLSVTAQNAGTTLATFDATLQCLQS